MPKGTLQRDNTVTALVALAGQAVAIAGALGPAIWAAYSKTTKVLGTE
jgi:hypothetical protein